MLPPSERRSQLRASARRLGLALALSFLPIAACHDRASHVDPPSSARAPSPSSSAQAPVVSATEPPKRPFTPARAGCDTVEVFAAGAAPGRVCVEDAAPHGLTVLDLSDTWTPRVFAPDPTTHDAPEYRAKYLELARQPNADLGLYGVAPTLTVLAQRLTDEKRRACLAAIDHAPLATLRDAMRAAADDRAVSALTKGPAAAPAIRAAQQELVCAGLAKQAGGALTTSTQIALDAFRRRHMIVAGPALDADTVAALALGGDELDLRGLLRGLRERVADAAGLVEDGSASNEHVLVAGRDLDLSPFAPSGDTALPDAAGDLVDGATDVAARELGWTSPDAARAFLAARGAAGLEKLQIAVALPAPPSWHSAAMDLRVEIDRGDVFYEMPGQAAMERKKLGDVRRPSFVVYAKDGEHEHALLRWSTTIGGWKKERTDDGEIALKYKESDVGDRFWRRIIAAPAWMPPDSTPETDLVHEGKDGSLSLKRDLIQPGFRNAYGLVMLIHDEAVVHGAKTTWVDHGIRTHGSVDYRSIKRGESHGCHRLYNQLALRLSGYLLAHRTSERRGKMSAGYHRSIEWNDQTVDVDVPTRGYLYELDPPVPVRVLPGRIFGESKKAVSATIPLATDDRSNKG